MKYRKKFVLPRQRRRRLKAAQVMVSMEIDDTQDLVDTSPILGRVTSDTNSINNNCNSAQLIESITKNSEDNLRLKLRNWAVCCNIPRSALDKLLKILKSENLDLPASYETLLGTACNNDIVPLAGGEFCYLGLESQLRTLINTGILEKATIYVQVNVDGLPLYRSSRKTFWPILCAVSNVSAIKPQSYNYTILPAALWLGDGKPSNASQYLSRFVEELKFLTENGLEVNEACISIKISSVVCDIPARSFIKQVKGHNGYCSCEHCEINGHYYDRMSFAGNVGTIRSDQSFRNHQQIEHHMCESPSPLEKLKIDMVKQFPYDYMHLILLGVVKKLLHLWMKGSTSYKLPTSTFNEMSCQIHVIAKHMPSTFARRPRGFKDLEYWKATEFRMLLLYYGPVLFKNFLKDNVYMNFMSLHTAIYILCSPELYLKYNRYAQKLLNYFVDTFQDIYGKNLVSINVHACLHLSDNAKVHGSLDAFSAFKFENYLQSLKRYVKCGRYPLKQAVKRISENNSLTFRQKKSTFDSLGHKLTYKLCDSFYKFDQMYVKIEGPIFTENNLYNCRKILKIENWYTVPCNSMDIGIVHGKGLGLEEKLNLDLSLGVLCVSIPLDNNDYYICPLAHFCNM